MFLGGSTRRSGGESVRWVAEATLTFVLFSDAVPDRGHTQTGILSSMAGWRLYIAAARGKPLRPSDGLEDEAPRIVAPVTVGHTAP